MRTELVDVILATLARLGHANDEGDTEGFDLALSDLLGLERTLREYDDAQRRASSERLDEALMKEQSRVVYDDGTEKKR